MVEKNAFERIKSVIDFIEDNLYENLSLEDIAEHSGLSKFHLHKIFKYFTGEKLMDYVRLRKLSNSTNELILSDLKIIDIANEYNFGYEQSYIRAFKKTFNISPNRYRKEQPLLEIKEKANLDYITPVGENGVIFKPKIIYKPEFYTVGVRHILHKEQNIPFDIANEAARDFFIRSNEIPHKKNKDIFMALMRPHPENQNHEIYIPCSEVRFVDEIPEGMRSYTIPLNRYASFKHISLHHPANITNELQVIYDYIFDNWLADAPFEQEDNYLIERIDLSVAHRNYGEYELLLPIKDKTQ